MDSFIQEEKEGSIPGPQTAVETKTGDKKEVGGESPAEPPPAPVVEETKVPGEPKEETDVVKPDSPPDEGQSVEENNPEPEAAEIKVVENPKEIETISPADNLAVQVLEDTEDNEEGKKEAVVEDQTLIVSESSEKKPGEIDTLPSQPSPDEKLIAESAVDEK